jgi:hypothetical protein
MMMLLPASKLKRRTGRPFKTVVNERLRMALARGAAVQKQKPFRVEPRAMGGPADGFSYDNVGAVLEDIEGARSIDQCVNLGGHNAQVESSNIRNYSV